MVKSSTARGRIDRTPGPTRRGEWVDRVFVRAVVVAFFLHAPLIPSRLFEWARLALFSHSSDYDDADAQAVVPIDLDLLAKDPVAEPPAVAPTAAPPPEPAAPPGDVPPDAGARPPAPRPAPTEPRPDAGPPVPVPVQEPMSAAGGAGKIAAKDPNVQLLLSGRALRKHPLGAFFSRVLLMVPEWRQFFQDTPVDPVRDFDHLLITAPRLKGDSSKMVAIMSTSLPEEVIHAAVGAVLQRTNGVWLEDAPVTAARARIAGAPRLVAMIPQKRLLVILPGDATDQLAKLKQAKPFRNSTEGMVVSLLTPGRPFKGFLPIPESLKWMRIALTPTADGGIDLAIDAGDASAEEARSHAADLTRELERRRKIDVLGLTSVEILDAVTFTAEGDSIRARTHVTRAQLGQMMAYVETQARARWAPASPPPRTEH